MKWGIVCGHCVFLLFFCCSVLIIFVCVPRYDNSFTDLTMDVFWVFFSLCTCDFYTGIVEQANAG